MNLINDKDYKLRGLFKFWLERANIAVVENDNNILREIVVCYSEVGEKLFDLNSNNNLDDIFRGIGCISERLLMEQGVKRGTSMYDPYAEDEFSIILNTLIHFGDKYNDNTNLDPLVFFDAVYVFCEKLVEFRVNKANESEYGNITNWLFHCSWIYYSHLEKAIHENKCRNVSLAASGLIEQFNLSKRYELFDVSNNIFELIIKSNIIMGINKEDMKGDLYNYNYELDKLGKLMLNNKNSPLIRKIIFGEYIKLSNVPHEKKKRYYKKLQELFDNDFGLRLD